MIAEALAQPITDLIEQAGTGTLPSGGPSDRLRSTSHGVRAAMDTGATAAGAIGAGWQGADADACSCTASGAARAGADLAEQGEGIATVVEDAAADVQRGVAELGGIFDSFLSVVACQGAALATPVGQVTVLAAAADHIERALAVVGRMRGELEAHAGAMAQFIPDVPLPPVPNPDAVGRAAAEASGAAYDGASNAAATAADDVRSWAAGAWGDIKNQVDGFFADAGDASGADAGDCGPDGAGGQSAAGADAADVGGQSAAGADAADVGAAGVDAAGVDAADAAVGSVPVTLPDGTVVTAPNAHAADAVQAALTQRGVPYSWGGEAPGQGLDCSGLTQWAYGQAGVDLPRLAQAQTVGAQIPADQVAPGDLAVWDGHVAMVVGDGRMIEAGNPVAVDPVRTSNAGMAFHGFFRPTAA